MDLPIIPTKLRHRHARTSGALEAGAVGAVVLVSWDQQREIVDAEQHGLTMGINGSWYVVDNAMLTQLTKQRVLNNG